MTNKKNNPLMPYLMKGLTSCVVRDKKLPIPDAVAYIMNSNLYSLLHDEGAKYWYLSSLALYEELKKEKQEAQKNDDDSILLFIAFCIENYQTIKKNSKEEILFLFTKYRVFDYLREVYEPLHTQGASYIIDEIELFIKSQSQIL